MDISLHSPQDADRLTRFIRHTTNAKQRDRYRCVQLAIEGETTPTIMRMLSRSRGFVQRWCYVYRDRGLEAVQAQSPPGRPPTLPRHQSQKFKQRVLDGPNQADDICALRGRDFARILREEFGARYQLSGVYELLRRLRISILSFARVPSIVTVTRRKLSNGRQMHRLLSAAFSKNIVGKK